MRYRLCLLIALCMVFSFSSLQSSTLAAACNAEESVYGEATYILGTLPSTGTYSIWTRMQAADSSHNRYQLEVNDDACYTIGGEGVSSTQWEWVNFQNGDRDSAVTYDFIKTTDNKIRLLGIDPAVKLDTVLVVADECIPEDLGDNCRNSTSIGIISQTSTNIDKPVSGIIPFSSLFSDEASGIQSIEYSADGQKIQKNNGVTGFDTTLLSNGSHEVTTRVIFVDGTVASETHTLEVDNPSTTLSPVTRWIRLNVGTLTVAGLLLGLISILGISFALLKRSHMRKLYARSHGLS